MKAFLKRAVVAVIGIPFALWVIWSGGFIMTLVLSVIAAVAAMELVKLSHGIPLVGTPWKAMLVAGASPIVAYAFGMAGMFLLLVSYFILVSITALRLAPKDGFGNLMINVLAAVYPGLSIGTFVLLRENPMLSDQAGIWIILFGFVGVWVADTAAYSIGSLFGKKKIAPSLSPNKTVEGTAAALVVAIAWGYFAPMMPEGLLGAVDRVVMGAMMGAMAVLGDLTESMIKRAVQVKDSGTVFPEHGGMLDRFDSLMGVIPTLLVYLVLRGILPLQ